MESRLNHDYNAFNMPSNKVLYIYDLLERNMIPVWLDGGWAVDALVGKQTRPHQDVDFLVPIQYINKLINILLREKYILDEQETELPYRFVVLKPMEHIMVDFHLVIPQKDGSMVFRITNYKENVPSYDYRYTAEGLSGIGTINGTLVPCISVEEQVRCRTSRKYSFDDPDRVRRGGINADRHDLDVIKELKMKYESNQ